MSAAAMPSDEKHDVIASDDWTGGPAPDWRRKTKVDLWVDVHPVLFLLMGVAVISLIKASDLRTDSYLIRSIAFVVIFASLSAVYASMFGGVWLFGKLVGKIKEEKVSASTPTQRNYLIFLLVIGMIVSQSIGPILIVKSLAMLVGWL